MNNTILKNSNKKHFSLNDLYKIEYFLNNISTIKNTICLKNKSKKIIDKFNHR